MLDILILGLATATVAVTVTQSKVFAPVRNVFTGWSWFHELISCPYCLGHWIAAVLVLLKTVATPGVASLDWIIVWLAVTAVAAIASGVIGVLFTD